MLRIACLLLPLATLVAKGQQPWAFSHGVPGQDVRATDLVWTPNGMVLTCDYADPPFHAPYTAVLIRLTTAGTLIDERVLASAFSSVSPKAILTGPDQSVHVIGNYSEHPDSVCGFFHYRCTPEGTVQDSTFIPAPSALNSYVENATFLEDGTIIIGGTLGYTSENAVEYFQLIKITELGEVITHYSVGMSGFNIQITRDVMPYRDGLLVSTENFPEIPGQYHRFSSDLDLLGEWDGQAPHPDPLNPLDSILKAAMTLIPTGANGYLVGGAFLVPNDQYSSAVYLADSAGTTLKAFVPHSAYYHDHSALFETIAAIDSATFWFLSWENIHLVGTSIPYEPEEPDVLHVYKLDHELNVLCEFRLDGFSDSTHYFPTRIKTSPDGGFVILGAKKDMTDANATMQAWAQKFDASDCNVGIEDHKSPMPAVIYPNPGSTGFEVVLSGQMPSVGQLTLHDARGVLVIEAMFSGSMGRVDCTDLPNGLYLYRITDRFGQLVATGRWVKQ